MLAYIFPYIYIHIYIFVYILICIHAYTYKIHSTEQIEPKRVQLQLTQSYCLELAQNCEVWNMSLLAILR